MRQYEINMAASGSDESLLEVKETLLHKQELKNRRVEKLKEVYQPIGMR